MLKNYKLYFLVGLMLIVGAMTYVIRAGNGFFETRYFDSYTLNSLADLILTALVFLPGGLLMSYAYIEHEKIEISLFKLLFMGSVIAFSMLIPLGGINLFANGY